MISQAMRPKMVEMGLQECKTCHKWFANRGFATHRRVCQSGSPDGAVGRPPRPDGVAAPGPAAEPAHEEVDLFSDARMQWLDYLDWEDVGRCPYSTIEPPQGAVSLYQEAHRVVDQLFERNEDDRAWKLHYFLIRVLFFPTKEGTEDDKLSATALVKSRCRSFLRGEWQHLWNQAANARMPKQAPAGTNGEDDAEMQKRMDTRARLFAREGQLSKAMAVFETGAVLDPRDADVMEQLEKLQAPDTEYEDFPAIPDGLYDDEDTFRYTIGTVQVPTAGGGSTEMSTMEYVKNRLKRGIAQSLSGARYEHYKCLPTAPLERMVEKVLNAETEDGPRSVITGCRGLALDKGGRRVRPLAIGEAIRRIAGRVVCVQDNATIAAILTPVMQYGVAVKGGIEYAYHSVRLHMLTAYDDYEQRHYAGDTDNDGDDVPGILKIDFRNGYNSTKRSKMISQVQAKMPRLLRFTRYCYAQVAEMVIMHQGAVVKVLDSKFGSQQGDPLGGHYFALSIYDFMAEFQERFPEACTSWIVDDLTVSDTQGQLEQVAQFIHDKGPEFGLFKNEKKGEFYTPFSEEDPTFEPSVVITRQYRYKHAKDGFGKLLGAPLGHEEFEKEQALELTKELTKGAKHLKRIQDAQLEYVLLKYCVCTVITHLLRMLEPGTVAQAIRYHEREVRTQFGRIAIEAARKKEMPNLTWHWAQQPVAQGGCGLRCLELEAPAAFMAAMGAVARRATQVHKDTGSTAANIVRSWFTQENAGFEQELDQLAERVNSAQEQAGGDAPNDKLCPSLAALEKMPKQFKLTEKLYESRKKDLLAVPEQSDEVRAFRLSNCQFNAGAWLNSIPTTARFKCSSAVFKTMLQMRLCIFLAFSNGVKQCECGDTAGASFLYGWHWATRCAKACRNSNHNRVRDIIAEMYKSLRINAQTEVKGLYSQMTSYQRKDDQGRPVPNYKPADVLVPGSATTTGKEHALDIAITDPTGKTAISRLSHTRALQAADIRHKDKMDTHSKQLAIAGEAGLPFVKVPLVFEITGAMGKETQKWWREVAALEKEQRGQDATSRKDMGLDWTFSANGFASYWLQAISMSMARTLAESVVMFIGKNQEDGIIDVHPEINTN